MKVFAPVKYDVYFDFDEWAEEIKNIPFPKDTTDPIQDFLNAKIDEAEERKEYEVMVALRRDFDFRIYKLFKKTIEEKGIEFQWI